MLVSFSNCPQFFKNFIPEAPVQYAVFSIGAFAGGTISALVVGAGAITAVKFGAAVGLVALIAFVAAKVFMAENETLPKRPFKEIDADYRKNKHERNSKTKYEVNKKLGVEEGHTGALKDLGDMYRDGSGTFQNNELAFKCYKTAANHPQFPNREAIYLTALMFERGEGTANNPQQAFAYYTKYVEKSTNVKKLSRDMFLANSHLALGTMYYEGRGTDKNVAKAKEHLELAVKGGKGEASTLLAEINTKK